MSGKNQNTRYRLLCAAGVLTTGILPFQSSAATWTGTTGSFTNNLNWDTGVVPGIGEPAVIANGGTAQFDGGAATNLSTIGLGTGSAAAVGTLEMSAGELSSTTLRVGENGGVGTLTLSGGDISVLGGAGAFSVAPASGSTGTVTMTGGTLTTAGELWIGPAAGGHAFFSLNGGTVICKNWGVVGRNSTDAWLTIDGGSWSNIVANNFTIGSSGSGVVNLLNGGLYSQNGIYVSEYGPGAGALSVSDGTLSANWMEVARNVTGSSGSLLVDGGALWLNELRTGKAAAATLRFSGGSLGARDGNAIWRSDAVLTNAPGAGVVTLYTGSQGGAARINTYSGLLSGNGAIAIDAVPGQSASGAVILSANNTYTGGTTLNGTETLQLGAGGAAGWISGTLSIPDGGDLAFARSDTVTNTVAASGTGGAVVQNGSGTLVLTDETSIFSSALANAGVLLLATQDAIPGTGASVTINRGGSVAVAGAYGTVNDWLESGRIATSSGGALALTGDSSEDIDLTTAGGALYGDISLGAAGEVTYSGVFTPAVSSVYHLGGGGGSLTFASAIPSSDAVFDLQGAVTLAGDNGGLTDGTTVQGGGTVRVSHPNALGSGLIVVTNAVLELATNLVATGGVRIDNAGLVKVLEGGSVAGVVENNALSAGAGTTQGLVFNGPGGFTHTDDVTGTGELAVIGGGTLRLGTPGQTISQSELWVGNNSSPGDLEMSDGTLNISNWLLVARGTVSGTPQSTFTMSGGTLNKSGSNGSYIGDRNVSVGTMVISNTAVFNAAGGNIAVSTENGIGLMNIYGGQLNQTVNDFIVANGNGQGTVNVYGGSVSNTGSGWIYVGRGAYGTGTLTLNGGSVYGKNYLHVGYLANANGSVNVAGGSMTVGTLIAGQSGNGTITQTGGTVSRVAGGDWRLGDAASGVGILNLSDGLFDTGIANFQVGATGRGTLNQSGGTLNSGAWPVIGRYVGGLGFYTLSGGIFNQSGTGNKLIVGEQGTGTFTVSGTGVANLYGGLQISGGAGPQGIGTVNLATGGTINTPVIVKGTGSSATFNFDGGTLRPAKDGIIIQGLTAVNVLAGGAFIDTGTNTVAVGQGLLSGAASDGGLTKLGSGTLVINPSCSYNGVTTVAAGTLKVSKRELAHRWSFNSSLIDSVGGSTATAIGSVTHSGTQAILAGGAKGTSYISLGANILPASNSPATIELWATHLGIQNWSRIFDFGNGTGNYIFMSWTQGTNLATDRAEVKSSTVNTQGNNTMQPYTLGQEFHISMVITPYAGANGLTLVQWYKMDAAGATLKSGSFSTPWTLAQLQQSNMWLGHSQWPNNDANASYNEVRIWNGALSQGQLAANSVLGPDTLPEEVLPVDAQVAVAAGTILDLDDGSLTLGALSGSGLVTNGTLAVSGTVAPGGTDVIGTLTLATSSSLTGTLLVDVTPAGTGDLLEVQGALDLSAMSLQIQDLSGLKTGTRYVIARCSPGALSGEFVSTNLDLSRWHVSYDNAAGEVRIVGSGLVILVY